MPVVIPPGVQVNLKDRTVEVKGKLGAMRQEFHPLMTIKRDGSQITVERPNDAPATKALHGLTRALIANMVSGVNEGFKRELQIEGVGFRSEVQSGTLVLSVGYTHPVRIEAPQGIKYEVDKTGRQITISGMDKELVGEMAARIRRVRKPEPYKGKGIRYANEVVRRKAGKAGKAAGAK
jgi:large subunit ribosomal protein L6